MEIINNLEKGQVYLISSSYLNHPFIGISALRLLGNFIFTHPYSWRRIDYVNNKKTIDTSFVPYNYVHGTELIKNPPKNSTIVIYTTFEHETNYLTTSKIANILSATLTKNKIIIIAPSKLLNSTPNSLTRPLTEEPYVYNFIPAKEETLVNRLLQAIKNYFDIDLLKDTINPFFNYLYGLVLENYSPLKIENSLLSFFKWLWDNFEKVAEIVFPIFDAWFKIFFELNEGVIDSNFPQANSLSRWLSRHIENNFLNNKLKEFFTNKIEAYNNNEEKTTMLVNIIFDAYHDLRNENVRINLPNSFLKQI